MSKPAPSRMQPPVTRAESQLLASIGMLAAGAGLVGHAVPIFNALALLDGTSTGPSLGQAIALMNAGRAADAARYLQSEALTRFPQDVEIQSYHALALRLSGEYGRSDALLRQIVDGARQAGSTAPLAEALLASPAR